MGGHSNSSLSQSFTSKKCGRDSLYGPKDLTHLVSRSIEWRSITSKEKEKLGLVTEDDGEFWFDINSKEDEEIILQLSQMDDGTHILIKDKLKLVIGFHLLKVESNREYRLHKRIPGSDRGSSDYIRSRHVFLRKTLSPGRYFVFPTTFDPGQDANFLLRLFSDKSSDLCPVLLDEPKDPWCIGCGCGSRPQVVTRVTVLAATALQKQQVIGQADPYVYIKCEGDTVRSSFVKNCLDPKWDFTVLFLQKKTR